MSIVTVIGYAGALMLLLGYAFVSVGTWKSDSHTFQCMNLFGAVFLVIYSLSIRAYPNVILNVVWTVVGMAALVRIGQPRSKS